jgi:AcrR family transcriptional regulator
VSSVPGFRRLPRAVREEQMLDAAVRVFSRQGYHATSVDEIAEAAGISKPMVYAYLGSKEELFIACLNREGLRLLEALAAAARGGPGARAGTDQRLWRGLRAFLGFVATHRDGWSVLYRQARGQEPFAGVLAQMRLRLVEIVTDMLADCSGDPDDAPLAAYALVGAAEAVADWVVDHPDADVDRAAERLMATVWLGLGTALRGDRTGPWRSDLDEGTA